MPGLTTPMQVARELIGTREIPGRDDNAAIMKMLKLDGDWPEHDEIPWCSAFVNWCCNVAGYERSYKLNARSWLNVGTPIELSEAENVRGTDVVILSRPPSPTNGHVGFFAGLNVAGRVLLLGGNQGDQVCVASFEPSRVIGVRRLSRLVPV